MADQFNDGIPVATNTILADISDIAETLGWLKDCLQHICNGFSNTVLTNLGFLQSVWIPASYMMSNETDGATPVENEYATNDLMRAYFLFDGATEQYVSFDYVFPEGWDRSTVKAKFYWASQTGSTAGDTVEWEIKAVAISNDDALDAAYGTSQVVSDTLLANNGTDLQVTAATPALTVGGTPALGDMVNFKISRNVSGTDNMTEDARFFGVVIQYLVSFPDASGTNALAAW